MELLAYSLGFAAPISIGGYFALVWSFVSKEERKRLGLGRMILGFLVLLMVTVLVVFGAHALHIGFMQIPIIGWVLPVLPGAIVAVVLLKVWVSRVGDVAPPRMANTEAKKPAQPQKVKQDENWDAFPSNLLEMIGSIPRRPFAFSYTRYEVWHQGKCIASGPSVGTIESTLVGQNLQVRIEDPNVNKYILPRFEFDEISTEVTRIMWSRDMLDQGQPLEKLRPKVSSLFFKQGVLSKVTFTINEPFLLVEFYQE